MRLRLTAIGAIGAALVIAGCGGGGGGPKLDVPPERAMSFSADKTAGAGSSKMAFEATTVLSGERLSFGGVGAFDYKTRQGSLSLDLSDFLKAVGVKSTRFEVLVDGPVVYMKFPGVFAKQLPGGGAKPWVKIDLAEAAALKGVNLSQLQQLNQDPSQILDYLRSTTGDVKEVGQETIRGVNTTQYEATIDLAKVPAQAPPELRKAAEASLAQLIGRLGTSKLPVQVWVDAEGLLRRFSEVISIPAGTTKATTSITMEFYDYGTKVDVSPPPADETIDLAAIVRKQGGRG